MGGTQGGQNKDLFSLTKHQVMIIVLEFVLVITALTIVTLFFGCDEWEIGINYPTLSSVPFEFGVSHKSYSWDNGDTEQEIRIGFVFVVLCFSFFRNQA